MKERKTIVIVGVIAMVLVGLVTGLAVYYLFKIQKEKNREMIKPALAKRWEKKSTENESPATQQQQSNESPENNLSVAV